jgi:hypothetical protein
MKTETTDKQKKFAVAIHVTTPDNKEFLNLCFVDAVDNIRAYAACHAILKIPQFSRIAFQCSEIPQEENRK